MYLSQSLFVRVNLGDGVVKGKGVSVKWTLRRGGESDKPSSKYANFYDVSTDTQTYSIMLGIQVEEYCELLEHHWINPKYEVYSLRYQLLPYIKVHYGANNLPMRFATETAAKTYVEEQIVLWETSLDNKS